MEEASGFQRLIDTDPKRWDTETIAGAIGKTRRYVQKRLALNTKIHARVKQALRDGAITVRQAEALAAVPAGD